jgi:hypothetical protein
MQLNISDAMSYKKVIYISVWEKEEGCNEAGKYDHVDDRWSNYRIVIVYVQSNFR